MPYKHPVLHTAAVALRALPLASPASCCSEEEEEEGDWDEEWEQQHSWLALPRDIPCKGVRVGRVPDTDPRAPLRGQFGIWAADDLSEGFLLGK